MLGYLIFTVGLGIGDTDVFDCGGIIGAIIGVIILLPFVGIFTRFLGGATGPRPWARRRARTPASPISRAAPGSTRFKRTVKAFKTDQLEHLGGGADVLRDPVDLPGAARASCRSWA